MNKKTGIIFLIVLVLIVGIFLLSTMLAKKSSGIISADDIPTTPKKYESNEYYNLNITDQELCTIYLNDFISILSTDISKAYDMLDSDYRNTRFSDYNSFVNYINTIYSSISSVNTYKVEKDRYYVYDKNGNVFIFVTNGVMNYKVYLDETTVKITDYK